MTRIKITPRLFVAKFLNKPFDVKARPYGFAEKKSSSFAALGAYFFSQSLALQRACVRSGGLTKSQEALPTGFIKKTAP